MSGIYKIICLSNNRFYIGSSINLLNRKNRHFRDLNNGAHHNCHLQRLYDKYGECSLSFSIIELCDRNKTIELEQMHLDDNKMNSLCINMLFVATFGDTLSNHPNKIDIIKRRTKSVLKTFSNMSVKEKRERYARYGNDNWSTGGNFKSSTIERLRKCGSVGGIIIANRTIGKSLKDIYGEEKSLEIRGKISNCLRSMKGSKNGFYGKKHTEELKQKLRNKMLNKYGYNKSKPVIIDGIKYISLKHASDMLKISISTIRYRVNSGGFDNYYYVNKL